VWVSVTNPPSVILTHPKTLFPEKTPSLIGCAHVIRLISKRMVGVISQQARICDRHTQYTQPRANRFRYKSPKSSRSHSTSSPTISIFIFNNSIHLTINHNGSQDCYHHLLHVHFPTIGLANEQVRTCQENGRCRSR